MGSPLNTRCRLSRPQMSAPAEAAPAEESAPMEFSDDEKKEFRKVTDRRTQSVSSASC